MSKFVNSSEVFPPELDLFQTPPTNSTCDRIQYVNYRSTTQFQEGSPLEFPIPGTGCQYVDLRRTVLKLKLKAFKENAGDIKREDLTAPVNLTLHSLFSRVEIYFNQKLVSGGDVMYPYKAYLETMLDYGDEAKDTQLSISGYYKDDSVRMEAFSFAPGNNTGFIKRGQSLVDGGVMQLEGPLLADICQQDRYILNQIEITIKLYPVKADFFLHVWKSWRLRL